MRNYELTVILPGGPADAQARQKKTLTDLEKKVESASGKVEKITEWGSRQLAYKIKKQDIGNYFLLNLLLPGDQVSDLDRYLQANEDVVRHLLVQAEKRRKGREDKEERKAARARKGENSKS